MINFSSPAFSRKTFAAVFASVLLGSSYLQAAPAAPQYVQSPGFHRQAVGDAVVTAVYDGYVALDPKSLSGLDQGKIRELMAKEFQIKNSTLQVSVNAFLVHTEKNLILIDSGSANCFGPTMGRMVDNIKAAGYNPADVDTVLLTHMHPDHACGITLPSGEAAFPNATVWADKDDADFWLNPESGNKLPQDQRDFLKMAQDAVAPYLAKGKFKVFTDGQAIVPGVSVMPTAGHTPGHTSYLITSGNEKLLVWGDIIHFHAVQLPHPEVTIEVDVDPKRAIKSREKILAQAASNGWLVGAAHLPFPGIGHVSKESEGYSWTPVEYVPLPGHVK